MINKRISVIIPIYNEEKCIIQTIQGIKEVMKEYDHEIIAVNDGSKDHSGKILSTIKNIKVINHPYNKGYGASLKTGIKNSNGQVIMIIDADGTYPIKDMPRLLSYIDKYDMVVGARIGKKVNIPFARKFAKFFLIRFANYLTAKKIPDLNSGMRVFNKEIALKFWSLFPQGFSFTTTITLASHTNGYSVKYVPIDYYKRRGQSTIHPIKDFLRFNSLIFRMILYFDPLKIFVPASVLVFLFALLRSIRDFLLTDSLGSFSVVLFFIALQIFFFGLVAELINKRMNI